MTLGKTQKRMGYLRELEQFCWEKVMVELSGKATQVLAHSITDCAE